jgi:hypothetical protein
MKIEFEFTDGSCLVRHDVHPDEAESEVASVEDLGILSAWRDDEPWFGLCADTREGTP